MMRIHIRACIALLAVVETGSLLDGAANLRCRRKERVYRREDVLGRDATSVFPTEIAAAAAAERSALAEAVGGQNFITETEVSRPTHDLAGVVVSLYVVRSTTW